MGSLSPMLIAAVALLGLGELLHIVGLATDKWTESGKYYLGLWRYSIPLSSGTYSDPSTELEAVRAMAILGMLCGLAATVVGVVILVFTMQDKAKHPIMPIVSLASSIAAAVFIIIGVIIFAAKIYNSATDYGFSFALCIVGGVLLPIGGVLVKLGGSD